MSISIRKNRVVIEVGGTDAHKLLNDVLTTPMPSRDDEASWWALLSPQGKIQAEGLIGKDHDTYWLDVAASVAESFFKRMRMYKLRADAQLTLHDAHTVGWSLTKPTEPDAIIHADPRGGGLGFRIIAPLSAPGNWTNSGQPFAKARIGMAISELGEDFAPDTYFPHDIGMDVLGGIDFEKGCYIGQEVVSRMRHKAKIRKRPVVVSGIEGVGQTSIALGERDVGTLGKVVDGIGVGIVRLDRISDPDLAKAGGTRVHLALPSWASYGFAESIEE